MTALTAFDGIASALATAGCNPAGGKGNYRCPVAAHGDHVPSLSLRATTGRAKLKCFGPCTDEQVLAALDLPVGALFDDWWGNGKSNGKGEPTAVYDYRDEQGALVCQKLRFSPKSFGQRRPDGNGGWVTGAGATNGVRRVLYRLPELVQAVRAGETIYVPEGEKDCDALVRAGVVATTAREGAKGPWHPEYTSSLKGAAKVVILADRDADGYRWARVKAAALLGHVGEVVVAQAAEGKDAADHLAAGRSVDELEYLSDRQLEQLCQGTNATQSPAPEEEPSSWSEIDLTAVVAGLLAGTITRPTPTIGHRSDLVSIFYEGKVNTLFGPSGDGKTMVADVVAVQQLALGSDVTWVDFEDDQITTASRLLELGATPEAVTERFHYFAPSEPFSDVAKEGFRRHVERLHPRLVVIDSAGEAMAIDGTKPNDDDSVARWMRHLPRFMASLGPCVVFIDHSTKAQDEPLYASGSQRKRAAVTGAAYRVEAIKGKEFGRGREGRCKLICAKDRNGNFARGTKVAELVIDATTTPYLAVLEPPEPGAGTDGAFKPTVLMEKACRWLEANPGATKNTTERSVLGRAEYVRQAVEILVSEGWVRIQKDGQALRHYVVVPYRAGDELVEEAAF
jgi:hypothetical protein